MTYEEDRTMKKYLMMLAAGLLTASLGGCAVVTDSSQTDSGELWIYCDGVFFRAEKAA